MKTARRMGDDERGIGQWAPPKVHKDRDEVDAEV